MKQRIFLSGYILPFAFIIVITFGCKTNKTKEETIIGEWKAHWETKVDETISGINGESLKMNGIINFMEDGKVEICAFGYEGCIFSDDTLKNVLNWKIDDSELRFIDSGADHGLPYTISKFTSNELQLTLLEDITLTLDRN